MVERGQHRQRGVDRRRLGATARARTRTSPRPTSSWATPARLSGRPAARGQAVAPWLVGLEAPDPHRAGRPGARPARRRRRSRPAGERAGDDRARAPGGERPVDPQAGPAAVDRGRRGRQEPVEGRAQLVERRGPPGRRPPRPRRRPGTCRPRGRPAPGGPARRRSSSTRPTLVRATRPWRDAEQLEDAQVLLGLRLPPLGGGDDEQAGITAPTPASMLRGSGRGRARRRRRPPAPTAASVQAKPRSMVRPRRLLLGQAVGVGAGEGQDEGRLAVVDVAGGGDDVQVRSASAARAIDRGRAQRVVGRVDGAQVEHRAALVHPGDDRPVGGPQRGGWSPSTATPADGISSPGSVPPPVTARRVDDRRRRPRASARARSSSTRPGGHPPEAGWPRPRRRGRRGRCPAGRRAPARRAAGPGPGGGGRRPPTRSARPAMIPAWGPPSSLSPENVTRAAPAARVWRTPARPAATAAGRRPATGRRRRAGPSRGRRRRAGRGRPASATVGRLGEAGDPVVGLVDLQQQADVVGVGHGPLVVGEAGAVRGAHLDEAGPGRGQDLGDPEAAADLHQLAPGHDDVPAAGQRGQGQQDGGGAVVDDEGGLGAAGPGQQARRRGPTGTPARRWSGRARGWCSRRLPAWATGARPRLVCRSTPVALTTGRRRAAATASASARAASGSPAAMAARAASTSSGWGRPVSARLRARASTDGGRTPRIGGWHSRRAGRGAPGGSRP